MKMKHLWEKKFRKIRIMYKEDSWQYRDGRVGEIFECDTHIADAVYLFNIKGYPTGNSCEGHPYQYILQNEDGCEASRKKYARTVFFDSGYLQFGAENKKLILQKLREKSGYFTENTHSDWACVKASIDWTACRSAETDGKKYSIMDIEMISKMFRTVYEEMWRTLLEVAQELPDKGSYYKSVELLPEGDDTKVGDIYKTADGFEIVSYGDMWCNAGADEAADDENSEEV